MTDKKLSPQEQLKLRQDRDKKELERLIKELKAVLRHHSPGVWEWISDTAAKIGEGITGAAKTVYEWGKNATQTVTNALSSAGSKIYDWASNTWKWITGTASDAGQAISNAVSGAVNEVGNIVSGIAENISDTFSGVADKGSDIIEEAKEQIKEKVKEGAAKTEETIIKVKDNMGISWEGVLASLSRMGDLFDKGLMINLDTYVEDGLKLYSLQKELLKRIFEEEKRVAI